MHHTGLMNACQNPLRENLASVWFCVSGKVQLPPKRQPPTALKSVFDGTGLGTLEKMSDSITLLFYARFYAEGEEEDTILALQYFDSPLSPTSNYTSHALCICFVIVMVSMNTLMISVLKSS